MGYKFWRYSLLSGYLTALKLAAILTSCAATASLTGRLITLLA
jgi:hypothetical protein